MTILNEIFKTEGRLNRLRYLKYMLLLAIIAGLSTFVMSSMATFLTGNPTGFLGTHRGRRQYHADYSSPARLRQKRLVRSNCAYPSRRNYLLDLSVLRAGANRFQSIRRRPSRQLRRRYPWMYSVRFSRQQGGSIAERILNIK